MPRRGENIRKRKDGRWEARYPKGKDAEGHTTYGAVYGTTYKEAKEKRRQIQEKVQLLTTPEKGVLFHELLSLWIADSQVRLKASTVYRYQYLIDTHILPELGGMSLESMSSLVINSFLASKLQDGRLDGSGGLSAAYVRSITLVISSALKFGAEQGMCSAVSSKIKKPVLTPKELPVLTVDQQNALENTLLTGIDESKLGIYISLYTGLRIGEICALTWDDVDLKNRLIYVRNTVVRVKSDSGTGSKTHLIIDTPKTASSLRCIPICSKLYSLLSNYVPNVKSRFVTSSIAAFISPRTFDYRFKKLLDESKIPHINYHALRHTFATRCIEAGVDVKSLSEILGHANVSITLNTYIHSSIDLKRSQLEKITCLTA